MKHYLYILAALAAFPAAAQADDACQTNVKVNGLVCDFCAQALEKTFGKREQVEAINVDLDNSVVQIRYHDGQSLDDATVKELITDAGYAVESIEQGC